MQRNFRDDSFEDFLKKNADQHRIHPSEKVWHSISATLNDRRRKTFFISGACLLILFSFGYFLALNPKQVQPTVATARAEVSAPTTTASKNQNSLTDLTSDNNLISGQETKLSTPASINTQRNDMRKENIASSPLANNLITNNKSPIGKDDTKSDQPATSFEPTIVDSDPSREATEEPALDKELNSFDGLLTIESVTNIYRAARRKAKVSFQLIFTPTVSYRKLSENKSYTRSMPQSNAAFYDVNNVVHHKPDLGLEVGVVAKYPISKNTRLKGGLQLNFNRYDIKAYNSTPEVATIALNTGSSVQSINTVTTYRNFNGYRADWLQSYSIQLSAPVGVEINLAGNKTKFGVGTTIQPTYVLSDRAYLTSSDYKNYSQVPSLTRHWNVNTSLETFVAYSTGKLQWQVGPQVRYQLLSSFLSKYPVKENLFDFGLKVGIGLNQQ